MNKATSDAKTIEYEGKNYTYRQGKWWENGYLEVGVSLARKLDKLSGGSNVTTLSNKDLFELVQSLGRDNRKDPLYAKAVTEQLRRASASGDLSSARYALPRLTSAYRDAKSPSLAVKAYEKGVSIFGRNIESAALCSSVGAAYNDLGDTETAMSFVKRASELADDSESMDYIRHLRRSINNENRRR